MTGTAKFAPSGTKIPSINQEMSALLELAEVLPTLALIDSLANERPELGAEKRKVAGGWLMYAGPDSPLNHLIGAGLSGAVSPAEIDEVEEFYRSRGSLCEIVVSPLADMSLVQILGERGYRITEWNNVFYRPLDASERFEPVMGIEIVQVGRESAYRWSELVSRGFAEYNLAPDMFVPFATAREAMCFVAKIEGTEVGGAGGSVFPPSHPLLADTPNGHLGLAALYGASTLPEYRGRGVQTALFRARLSIAAKAGCRTAVVVTQPGTPSQRNAERAGFQLAYTKVAMQRRW